MRKYNNDFEDFIRKLYIENAYLEKHPSLHIIDSPWKIFKVIPLIDKFISYNKKEVIKILDVGGGAGLILKGVSTYIEKKHHLKVDKFALDLSQNILKIQKKKNPDLKKILNEDIRDTSLENKEIDLTLMIDVLEHIPSPSRALKELRRISEFVLFKVPLEDNLYFRIGEYIRYNRKRNSTENFGHINFYNYSSLKSQIEKYMGYILKYNFTNVNEYILQSTHYKNDLSVFGKLTTLLSMLISKISPKLSSFIFLDYITILSKCY